MSIVIVATITPLPERRAEVLELLDGVIERVHAEDAGCELYALHEGRDRLIMIEKWADQEAMAAHGSGAAFRTLTEGLEGKLVRELDVQVVRPHPAGTGQQGTL
jgi:quinol monooxygenase YgiN